MTCRLHCFIQRNKYVHVTSFNQNHYSNLISMCSLLSWLFPHDYIILILKHAKFDLYVI
jgi:hypothetical protein